MIFDNYCMRYGYYQRSLAQASADDRKNQRLGLLQGLLRVRCWKWAKVLFAQLESMGVNACLHLPVAQALCSLLHAVVGPLYAKACPSLLKTNSVDQQSSWADLGIQDDTLENVTDWQQFGPTVWSLLAYLKFQVN